MKKIHWIPCTESFPDLKTDWILVIKFTDSNDLLVKEFWDPQIAHWSEREEVFKVFNDGVGEEVLPVRDFTHWAHINTPDILGE